LTSAALSAAYKLLPIRSPVRSGKLIRLQLHADAPDLKLITAKDLPHASLIGPIISDEPVLPRTTIRYAGQIIGLLAVPSRQVGYTPSDWLKWVDVICQESAAVYRPKPVSALGLKEMERRQLSAASFGSARGVRRAFDESAHIVWGDFYFPPVRHAYLRADTACADYSAGLVTVRTSTQAPFELRQQIATVLNLPDTDVSILANFTVGATFGAHLDPLLPCLAALGAFTLESSVELSIGLDEQRMFGPHSHAIEGHIRLGCDNDGRLLGLDLHVFLDAGAYSSYGPGVLRRIIAHAGGPYNIRNVHARGSLVWTNDKPASAFRGFGVGPLTTMLESQIDRLARHLGYDPINVRRRNLVLPGAILSNGQQLDPYSMIAECLDRVEALLAQFETKDRDVQDDQPSAFGISLFIYGIGNTGQRNPATVRVTYSKSGSIELATSTIDMGQGSHAALRRICADALGDRELQVKIVFGDTSKVPDSGKTSASRTVHYVGLAVVAAVQALIAEGASLLRSSDSCSSVRWDAGNYFVRSGAGNERAISIKDVISLTECGLTAVGIYDPPVGEDIRRHYAVYAAGANVVGLAVDLDTGRTELRYIGAVHDLGKVIDPPRAEAQVHGGIAMAASIALAEFGNPDDPIAVLASNDLPHMSVELLNGGGGTRWMRGIGEPVVIGFGAAVLNAHDGIDVVNRSRGTLHPFQTWILCRGSACNLNSDIGDTDACS
jgi:CO/xanthine dehydrogenase Mo-binding subunit